MRAMSTRTAGMASRSFISGSSEWPPGEHLGVVAVLGERGHRLLDRAGPHVLERRRDHAALLAAAGPVPTARTMLW